MPSITVRTTEGETILHAGNGESVMRAIQKSGRPGFGECEGSLACATCHVVVDPGWAPRLVPPCDDEEAMLDSVFDLRPTSRLSCQIQLAPELDGIALTIP